MADTIPWDRFSYYYYPDHQTTREKTSHIGHANHLCEMAEKGVVSLERFKDLVKNPKFICKKCGRAATKEENLCEPVPL